MPSFLADRTNGRAYATVLRLSSSSVCDVMYCGQTVQTRAKVKCVTPIRLERDISKMAGDRDSVPKDKGVDYQ